MKCIFLSECVSECVVLWKMNLDLFCVFGVGFCGEARGLKIDID